MLSFLSPAGLFLALICFLPLCIGVPTELDRATANVQEKAVARETSMLRSAWG